MKFLSLAFMLLAFNAFAQSGGDRVGSAQIMIPVFEMSINPNDRIRIYNSGKVARVVSQLNDQGRMEYQHTLLGVISNMGEVYKCSKELSDLKITDYRYDNCSDDLRITYTHSSSKSIFAKKECGKYEFVNAPCAKRMVNIFNAFFHLI